MSSAQSITAPDAPAPIGPYSHAVAANGFLFCSGQTPTDPATGELVQGDIADQTTQVMKNIGSVLKASGLTYDDVVKTTIFLAEMSDFAAVNDVYGKYFTTTKPARSTVAVKTLPKHCSVEIEVIALLK
jgi:2-iminobutanoate/2-iminopropanoate deaminase